MPSTSTSTTRVAIIGAGLAGLNAARRLHLSGIDFLLLETRERPGGRILSANAEGVPDEDGFDLGPSWFWPERQPAIAALVRELGLESFPQRADGDVVFERMAQEAPRRLPGLRQDQQSQRIAGGSAGLTDALVRTLPAERLRFARQVARMRLYQDSVDLAVRHPDGHEEHVRAAQVIAALPPRLMAAAIELEPEPDRKLLHLWRNTPTWMAPHAKFFALFDEPFWREAGLSGTGQSLVGPLAEIHDATTRSGQAALFGFIGISARQRAAMGEAALKASCLQQLARMFGPDAANARATILKDWAADPMTATAEDAAPTGHPPSMGQEWVAGPWKARLTLAGSETSPIEAGLLAGAVEASGRAVETVRERIGLASTGETR